MKEFSAFFLTFFILFGGCSPDNGPSNDDPCDGVDCGHGICDVEQGEAVCICEDNYRPVDLTCVESCADDTCSGHGTCDDSTGELICTCDQGYDGDRCDECAEGYHHEGGGSGSVGDCVPDIDLCDPDPCETDDPCINGTCSCIEGAARCECETGYEGPTCDWCASGYHRLDEDGDCVICNQVRFTLDDSSATTVLLTGEFTGWASSVEAGAYSMTNTGGGHFVHELTIEPSGRYEYKYIVDGVWRHDANNPNQTDDGKGGLNNFIDICTCAPGPCEEIVDPDWRDVVMYFVMVDRFYDSDGYSDIVTGADDGPADGASGQYMGGDLAGVTDQLDYLNGLGVTAIWLSAPYDNRDEAGAAIDPDADEHMYSGYHGYWPSPADISYADPDNPSPRPVVESRIGTETTDAEDDLRDFISAAHGATSANGQGIRVLFDYVMNHVDSNSELYQNHHDWFVHRDGGFALCGPEDLWNHEWWGTRCAFTDYLPPFNFEDVDDPSISDAARAWSINDALWWAIEFGIDGYRLDAIKHVPFVWLTDLRDALNDRISEPWGDRFYLVGETFAYDDQALLRSYVEPETMLDGQFDFPFKARLCEAVFSESLGLDEFSSWMDCNDTYYGDGSIMTTWIGNHDIPRAIHFASGEITDCRQGSNTSNGWISGSFQQPAAAEPYQRLGVAFAIMMTNRGIPLIYYGDEIGLAGGGDPDNRRMMVFEDSDLNAHQIALRESVGTLAHIRAENPALSRGSRTTHSVDANTWVYTMGRCAETHDVTVAINRSDAARDVEIPAGTYVNLFDDSPVSGGTVELQPFSYLVLATE